MSNSVRTVTIDCPLHRASSAPLGRSASEAKRTGVRGFALRVACAAALALGTLAAHGERSEYQLRYFELETSRSFHSDGEDGFANGDPSTGIVYNGNVAGTWTATSPFGPGAELTGPDGDFLGRQYGLGALDFRFGHAAKSTSNLTPPGFDTYSLALVPNLVPNSQGLGVVHKDGGFSVFAAWNYQTLQPGESLQLSINGTGGPNWVDRLNLRYGTGQQTGLPFLRFEQDSRTGFPDNPFVTRTILASTTPTAIYAALADVDYIGLQFERVSPTASVPNPGVRASVVFFDAALADPNNIDEGPKILAEFPFGLEGSTFLAPDAATSVVFVAGNWLQPVPEPGTSTLWLFGLLGLGFAARRRRSPSTTQTHCTPAR